MGKDLGSDMQAHVVGLVLVSETVLEQGFLYHRPGLDQRALCSEPLRVGRSGTATYDGSTREEQRMV